MSKCFVAWDIDSVTIRYYKKEEELLLFKYFHTKWSQQHFTSTFVEKTIQSWTPSLEFMLAILFWLDQKLILNNYPEIVNQSDYLKLQDHWVIM